MNKLDMAHEYAIEMAKQGIPLKSCKELGWKYADAMQAEADKREPKGFPVAIKESGYQKPQERPFFKETNHSEPQPEVDWRLAPSWASKFTFMNDRADWVSSDNSVWVEAPSFGFTGSHIVERPHD